MSTNPESLEPEPTPRFRHGNGKSRFLPQLTRYRDLVVRKWWVLALGALAGLLVEGTLLRFQPPAFVSIGQMIVNVKLSIPQGALITEELNNFLGTQAALMQSDLVVSRAYSRVAGAWTNPPPAPPSLKVSVSPRTSIFILQARASNPRFAQEFLQAAMEEYIRLKREMRKQASDTTVADLTEQVLVLEKDLHRAEEQLVEFQSTNSMVWVEEQGNLLATYLAGLNQRLEGLRSEHDLLQTLTLDQNVERLQALGGTVPLASDSGVIASVIATNALVNSDSLALDYLKAKQQLLLMKADQQDLAQYLRPKHPKMLAMAEEISRRERLLEIYRQQNVEQLAGRKAAVALQVENLQRTSEDWNRRAAEISRRGGEYQKLKANVQRLQGLYQQLLATVQTLDANKEIGAETVAIMEGATPAFVDTQRKHRNLVLAALGCLGASLGLLLLLERLDDRVNSVTELEECFAEPVLGQIPREKGARVALLQPDDQRHGLTEAYRNLRSCLFYLGEREQRPKCLLLTSSIPNEGKSLTAANLALMLGQAGSKVLLVDADLRKGLLHQRFGVPANPGFCEFLQGKGGWEELLQPTRDGNVSFLPRGSLSNRSSELFLSEATSLFLREAGARYDFVLLDSAPVLAADDVTSLAPLVEGVLFVVRAEHTSARVAQAALDLLYQRQARVLGLVFNAVRITSGQYHYYKYQDYYTPSLSKSVG